MYETNINSSVFMWFHGLLQCSLHHIPLSLSPWSYISSLSQWPVSSQDHGKVRLTSPVIVAPPASFTTFNQYSHTTCTVCSTLRPCWHQQWVFYTPSGISGVFSGNKADCSWSAKTFLNDEILVTLSTKICSLVCVRSGLKWRIGWH